MSRAPLNIANAADVVDLALNQCFDNIDLASRPMFLADREEYEDPYVEARRRQFEAENRYYNVRIGVLQVAIVALGLVLVLSLIHG